MRNAIALLESAALLLTALTTGTVSTVYLEMCVCFYARSAQGDILGTKTAYACGVACLDNMEILVSEGKFIHTVDQARSA